MSRQRKSRHSKLSTLRDFRSGRERSEGEKNARKQSSNRKSFKMIIGILAALLISYLLYWGLNKAWITEVSVSTDKQNAAHVQIDSQAVTDSVNNYLDGTFLARHRWLLNTDKLTDAIKANNFNIGTVVLDNTLLGNNLNVVVT